MSARGGARGRLALAGDPRAEAPCREAEAERGMEVPYQEAEAERGVEVPYREAEALPRGARGESGAGLELPGGEG